MSTAPQRGGNIKGGLARRDRSAVEGAAKRHSSTKGQRGERKEQSMAAEGQSEAREKQGKAETENIKKQA